MKEDLKRICRCWEKRRIAYNVVLIAVTAASYWLNPIIIEHGASHAVIAIQANHCFLIALPFLALAANLLFFLGPLAEVYLYLLDVNRAPGGRLIFLAGTTFAAFVAFLVTLNTSHFAIFG